MAIALTLKNREQDYKIYGGSAGFTKIIAATGLVESELTTAKILEVFSDLERRKAIVSILLDEGEFEPDPDLSTDRKKEAFVTKTAKQLDTGWIINLVGILISELNAATTALTAAVPITQEQIVEHISQEAIARQAELPLANITEGE